MAITAPLRTMAASSALVVASVLATTSPVEAAPTTFVVDTLSDDTNDGNTLRDAINSANANPGADTIGFAAGLTGTLTLTGGFLSIVDDITINGPGSDVLTIDADGSGRSIGSLVGAIDFSLTGVTLTGGNIGAAGGALALVAPGTVRLDDVQIVGNAATGSGGGLYIFEPTGTIDIAESRFDGNTSNADGGGIYIADSAAPSAPITITDTVLDDNEADNNGGAAFIEALGRSLALDGATVTSNRSPAGTGAGLMAATNTLEMLDSDFAQNTASLGGNGGAISAAIINEATVRRSNFDDNEGGSAGAAYIFTGGSLTFADSTVTNNRGGTGGTHLLAFGGALSVRKSHFAGNTGFSVGGANLNSLDIVVDESTFDDNEGDATGGLLTSSLTVDIIRSTISNNTAKGAASSGGGLHVDGGALTLEQSTVSGNSADDGGGIALAGGMTTATLFYSTITNNTATAEAGGVWSSANQVTLNRAVLAGNAAPMFADSNDAAITANHSLLGDSTGLIVAGGDNLPVGTDPKLGPLQDNTGPTLTHLPAADSPLIDAGGFTLAPPDWTDQRGRVKPQNIVDIGSVEVATDDNSIWVPVEPARIVDTRTNGVTADGINQGDGVINADSEVTYTVAGRAGIPADAVGVVANITAVAPATNGFLTAHPCVTPRPVTASLNYTSGVNLGNEVIIGLDAGDLCIYSAATTHLTVDVVGFIPADSTYLPYGPARFLDTRDSGLTIDGEAQGGGPATAGSTTTLQITDRGGVDKEETVVIYITAVTPTQNGFITVWDCLSPRPLTSSLNYVAGVNRGNEIVTTIANKNVCIYTSSEVQLTADVVGIFRSEFTNFVPLPAPSRLLDTRTSGTTIDGAFQGGGTIDAGGTITLDVAGRAGIVESATTVAMNLTAVSPADIGFITAYPCGVLTNTASVNYVPGVNGGNEIIAPLSSEGKVCLYSSQSVHITADVTGWTSP